MKKDIGDSVSRRGKYGFAAPFWMMTDNRDRIGMNDVINSSSIFEEGVFQPTFKDTIFKAGNERLIWMAYSIAMTKNKLSKIRK